VLVFAEVPSTPAEPPSPPPKGVPINVPYGA
jgi:hypothetical protein